MQRSRDLKGQPVTPTLRRLTAVLVLLALVAAGVWIVAGVAIYDTLAAGHGFPLGDKFPAFEDITIYRYRFQLFHTAAFFQPAVHSRRFPWPPPAFAYPPAAALVYTCFYLFQYPEYVFVALISVWTIAGLIAIWKLLSQTLGATARRTLYFCCLLLFSFPLIFLADRANIELLVWMTITAGTVLCLRGRSLPAAVLFGIAASVKIYPILLLGLFVTRRVHLRALLTGLVTALALTGFALWFAGPTTSVAFHGFFNGVSRFNAEHAEAARRTEAVFDHSLFSPVKVHYVGTKNSPLQWTTLYFAVAALGAASIFFFRVRTLPFLNRLTFLTLAMVLLPPVSYEYTLIHLYLPMLLLLLALIRSCYANATPFSQLTGLAAILIAMLPLGLLGGGTFLYAGEVQLAALLVVVAMTASAPWGQKISRAEA